VAPGGSVPTRLYTRTGDGGQTALAGGARVAKDSLRVEAFGTLDELGAQLGVVLAQFPPAASAEAAVVSRLQHELFVAQTELARAPEASPPNVRIEHRHVERLEADLDRYSADLGPMDSFVLARGAHGGAALHVARTVARRAERSLWALHRVEPQRPELLQWTNRLSDLLFALALTVNRAQGEKPIAPEYSV
jgi:cob(I)alamin adenosyltransferase